LQLSLIILFGHGEKIIAGKGTMEDIDTLKELSYVIKDTALCGLGQTAPNPILSTLDVFYDEYVAHIKDKKCIMMIMK